ncbi:DUF427 domain-containing protein [soil metagenome]
MSTTQVDPDWRSAYDDRFDYRVDILRRRNRITVMTRDEVQLATSDRTLLVDEQNHGLVFYIPVGDVAMVRLERIDRLSHCPYKGVASYWALAGGDEPVAWSYETPYPEVSQLAGHMAFYQDRVTVSLGVAAFPIPKKG